MTRDPRISAILLAAGLSQRLGRNKLLLPAGGMPVVRRAALALAESRAAEVIAVVGHEAPAVSAALEGLRLRIVHNPGYAQGQSTSLRAGLAQAAPETEGFLFALGDQPLLTAGWVDRLIGAFAAAPEGTLAAALYHGGRRGNPVLLATSLRGELARLEGDEGARKILRRLEEEGRLLAVPAGEEDLFLDLDTEADHARLLKRLGGGG
ncbi:MAG: hypothetical protein A3J27_03800 [Candidatus Tectomicrobia bacterium RIFCSPLOWO2_12_FULL_69_37]|nr:MAG: hypothetical protein A3J27_03800 [Candidatus Tectomicrobia bacterium RIFCSPLOWO2_12_FULL_69_37]